MKTVKLPDILPYPPFFDVEQHLYKFKNVFCYVFKGYPRNGIAVMICREAGDVFVRTADFNGTILEPTDNKLVASIMERYLNRLVVTMKAIRLGQAIYYFSCGSEQILVDMRVALDKYCGPGYLNDFFGKQGIPIQSMINQPIILTDENMAMLLEGKGDYSGSVIVKPSAFKFTMVDKRPIPLYGVIREIKVHT